MDGHQALKIRLNGRRRSVRATSRPGLHGPVVELIGVQTVGAAETFTQALLSRPLKVTRVGENTQGVFSDVLERRLPNGSTMALPNERYLTDGKSYDIVGIAPDVFVESLSQAARATAKDAAVEKAIELLRKSSAAPSESWLLAVRHWLSAAMKVTLRRGEHVC